MQMNLFDLHCRGATVFLTVRSKIRKKCFGFIRKSYIFALQLNAEIAQLVEHQLPKLRVAGSIPVFRSSKVAASEGCGDCFYSGKVSTDSSFSGKELLYLCYYLPVL